MSRLASFACVLALAPALFAADEPLIEVKSAPGEPSEMKQLFNGKDLTGWDGDPRLWSVKDGVIHGETTKEEPAKGNTFLVWKDGTVKDFDLRLSFRCNASNNSGIQYRSKHFSDKPENKWIVRGYQHELRNESKLPNVAGFIYDEGGKRGRICLVGEKVTWHKPDPNASDEEKKAWPFGKKEITGKLISAEEYAKLFKLDDWNDVVIIGKGNHIQHYMNGRLTLDFTDENPDLALKEGVLALQLHGGAPMWAEFKNIRVKNFE